MSSASSGSSSHQFFLVQWMEFGLGTFWTYSSLLLEREPIFMEFSKEDSESVTVSTPPRPFPSSPSSSSSSYSPQHISISSTSRISKTPKSNTNSHSLYQLNDKEQGVEKSPIMSSNILYTLGFRETGIHLIMCLTLILIHFH